MKVKKNMGHWLRYRQEHFDQEVGANTISSNFGDSIKEYKAYFENILTEEENFKAVVTSLPNADLAVKNQIIELHNHAKFNELYGVRLY